MTRSLLALIVVAPFAAGCNDTSDSPTGPTVVATTTEHFAGTLAVGDTRFYSFTVNEPGTVRGTLASVALPASGAPVAVALGIGMGIPRGTGCAVTTEIETGASLNTQLTALAQPGVYCVRVNDPGTLTEAVAFGIRFVHP